MGLGVVAVSNPPSSSLWKCGNPRLVRVSKLGGTGNDLRPRFRYKSHRASFPQGTRNSAHFGANVVVGGCTRSKCAFPETRAERTLLQTVVQSHKMEDWRRDTSIDPDSNALFRKAHISRECRLRFRGYCLGGFHNLAARSKERYGGGKRLDMDCY